MAPELTAGLDDVLSSVVAAHEAAFGSLEVFGAETGTLQETLLHGFAADAYEHGRQARGGLTSALPATQLKTRVVIEDVQGDEAPAPYRSFAAAAGFRAVQSTPLLTSSGENLGVLSTYFRQPRRLSTREMRLADLHATVAVDMIETARANARLLRIQQELAHLTRVMSMAELTASVGHNVKQPLGAILANAGACLRLLAQWPTDLDQARASIERIVRDAKRATEVLEAPSVVREATTPAKTPLDVNAVIRTAIALTRNELREKAVILHEDLQELPLIWGDRVQLQQAMVNLLLNAIEAMEAVAEQGRVIQIESRREARRDVVVRIRDTGAGVGALAREQLYEPFFSTKPRALGLGLAICRRIVHAHGGALSVHSNADRGATFELALPAGEPF